MGFNKRYITKDSVLSCIKEGNDLNRLLRADALIIDNWSLRFFENYDTSNKYKEMRDELEREVIFSSNLSDTINHRNFNKLRKLSNILENLIKAPSSGPINNTHSWTEVLLAASFKLGEVPEEYRGKFEKHRQFYINAIINLYTTESRDKIIDNILNESK
jgi:hypothetical protein